MIGTYNESSLHEALKQRYAAAYSGRVESEIGGCVADVVAAELAIEIQTGSFAKIKPKLESLLAFHGVLVVYPIAAEKRIVRVDPVDGKPVSSRLSPRRGSVWDLFGELIRFPHLASRPGFAIEAVLVSMTEFRVDDGKGSWRRKGVSIVDRELTEILQTYRFAQPADYLGLLPDLVRPFTVADLADTASIRIALARKAVYCLKRMGAIAEDGKRGRFVAYRT
jgi:hypothetical protein